MLGTSNVRLGLESIEIERIKYQTPVFKIKRQARIRMFLTEGTLCNI